MRFPIGTKVKFIHTGDEGTVVSLLDAETVNVRISGDDMEIPVNIENIVPAEQYVAAVKVPKGRPKMTQMNVPPPPPRFTPPPLRVPVSAVQSSYSIMRSMGIQLAFDPIHKDDGSLEKYLIYVLNDTRMDVVYNFALFLGGKLAFEHSSRLQGMNYERIGEMWFDDLNESPAIEMECWRILTDGGGKKLHKELKIKAKTFFTKVLTAPMLDRPVHHFRIFEKHELESGEEPSQNEEDLKAYTERNAQPQAKTQSPQRDSKHEVKQLAEFSAELDLHVEKLVPEHRRLNHADILNLQIRRFEQYLDQAVRLGMERVFIVHGVGEGKLKNAIATILLQHPYVKTFKNEYHPRYGYGATEIEFL
jgi:hypothetical protein